MDRENIVIVDSFRKFNSEAILRIEKLMLSGSNRKYYRLFTEYNTYIATINKDDCENEAFFYLQSFFFERHLPVPALFFIDRELGVYFQEDLGDITFYSYMQELKKEGKYEVIAQWYQRILDDLLSFQFSSLDGLDFSKCYPISEFNEQAVRWDLNYFKYMFLKLTYADFHEQKLERDFDLLTHSLLSGSSNYFVYRDFQSRNIMLHNNKLYYIDFQGGRKGALFYDVASLLYDAKAELSEPLREQLLDYYLDRLTERVSFDRNSFKEKFYAFVLFRILQALGAYGYRGIYEQKEHFIKSIQPAFHNLTYLFEHTCIKNTFPYLTDVLLRHKNHPFIQQITKNLTSEKLTVHIKSFSYKNGYPPDDTVHGGGYVFDCRALPNPGKDEKLKYFTGQDIEIVNYMEQYTEVRHFLSNVFQLVDRSIDYYMERNFEYLSVAFGCTGGQHRSVFCAEQLAKHIKDKYKITVVLNHLNKDNWITR